MAGFSYKKSLAGNQQPVLVPFVIKNSVQLTVGDPVNVNTDGFADLAANNERIAGVVMGFTTKNGGQTTLTTSGTVANTTVTAASDNQTVAKVKALVCVDPFAQYELEADATLGTTTGSNLSGIYFDITGTTGAVKADENVLVGGGSNANGSQLYSIGPSPENPTTHILCSIRENEMFA